MGFFENKNKETADANEESEDERRYESGGRGTSEAYSYATDVDDDEEGTNNLQLGPQYSLKEQLEKDKVCFFCSNYWLKIRKMDFPFSSVFSC